MGAADGEGSDERQANGGSPHTEPAASPPPEVGIVEAGEPNVLMRIGGDVSFTIVLTMASELRDLALESGAKLDELVLLMLSLYLCLLYLPMSLSKIGAPLLAWLTLVVAPLLEWLFPGAKTTENSEKAVKGPDAAGGGQSSVSPPRRSTLTFIKRLYAVVVRIVLFLAVQLTARSVAGSSSQGTVRLLGLLSVTVFFLWVEASGTAMFVGRIDGGGRATGQKAE